MSLLGARSTGKLTARVTVTSFCDVCHQLTRVTRTDTVFGIKWFCEEHQQRAAPVATLSDVQVAEVHAVENAVLAVEAIDQATADLAAGLTDDDPADFLTDDDPEDLGIVAPFTGTSPLEDEP